MGQRRRAQAARAGRQVRARAGHGSPRQAVRAGVRAAASTGHGTVQLWEKRASKPLRVAGGRLRSWTLRDIDLGDAGRAAADVGGPAVAPRRRHRPARRPRRPGDHPGRHADDRCWVTTTRSGPVEIALDDRQAGQTVTVKTLHAQTQGRRRASTFTARWRSPTRTSTSTSCSTGCRSAGLPGVATSDVPVSGFVSAKLHVGGRPDRPELAGDIDLAQVRSAA